VVSTVVVVICCYVTCAGGDGAGLVSKPACQVAEEREHSSWSRSAWSVVPPRDVQRRADPG